jgi:beta-galactosidase
LNPTEENNIKTEKIGFRTFEFKKNGPFYLNGERLLIRGTHRHEDQAGYGAAEPDSLVRKEMIMMKEMGVNFVRLGHYQQSELVLDLCDSLGFMVWEEIPWCRGGLGGEKYQNQAKQMLTNMITQHYNHPSVIIWGLGNENDWAGDTEVFDKEAIRGFMTELNDLSHQLDPSRKTGIRRCKFCTDLIDVYSPSIWAGWYGGKFTEYKKVSYREMKKTDHFFHMEWGGSSHAFRHSEDPDKGLENIMTKGDAAEKDGDFLMTGGKARVSKDGTWTTSYMVNLFDWTLKEQETMEWLTGAAAWIFKDYSTPVRPTNPLPYVNQKGVVERDLKKKESYYVFQSYWAEKAMLHIYGSTWDTRWGTEGEDKLLKVYSNCEKVELFLNGKSLGFKYRDAQNYPAAGLRWHATFKKGKNEVRAIGFKNGVKVEHEISFNYQTEKWGAPTKLELKKIAETADEVTIEARIYDKNGVQCLDARNFIRFGLTGEGRLVDNLGTSDGSRYIQVYNGRAIIKVKTNQGISVASVTSEGLEPAFLTIK